MNTPLRAKSIARQQFTQSPGILAETYIIDLLSTTQASPHVQLATRAALLAYLDALALAEPLQERLWQESHLTLTQISALRHLRVGPQTITGLGELTGLSAASISRLVDRLEKRGLVSRRRDDADRRVVEVGLTPGGEVILGEARVFRGSDLHRAVMTMTDEERRRLTAGLTRLVQVTRDVAARREGTE